MKVSHLHSPLILLLVILARILWDEDKYSSSFYFKSFYMHILVFKMKFPTLILLPPTPIVSIMYVVSNSLVYLRLWE